MAARGPRVGTPGTCRHCGAAIECESLTTWSGRTNWHHLGSLETHCGEDSDRQRATPREYCMHIKNSGDSCNRAVKHEDIAAGHYACGFHMRQEIEAMEQRERYRKQIEERAIKEEIEAWEISVYQKAEEEVRIILPENLIGDQHATRKYYGNREILNDTVELDWFQLAKALKELVEKVHAERED